MTRVYGFGSSLLLHLLDASMEGISQAFVGKKQKEIAEVMKRVQ
jgi:hypothetical protein